MIPDIAINRILEHHAEAFQAFGLAETPEVLEAFAAGVIAQREGPFVRCRASQLKTYLEGHLDPADQLDLLCGLETICDELRAAEFLSRVRDEIRDTPREQ